MGAKFQNTNKRYANGARILVDDIPITDGKGKLLGYTEITTIDNNVDTEYTAEQVLGGFIVRDGATTVRTDTLPSAQDLLAGIQNDGQVKAGTSFEFSIWNTQQSFTLNINVGDGGTIGKGLNLSANRIGQYLLVFTNTSPGNEAYIIYLMGTL